MPQTREELIEDFERLLDIQCSSGNWDADPYMHGMANGMIMFHSMAKDHTATPDFLSAPSYWKARIPYYIQGIKRFFERIWLYFLWIMASVITIITGLRFEFKNRSMVKYRDGS